MKNTNRYKWVSMLVFGLVLSALNAMAEVKTIVTDSNKPFPFFEIKEGEVGTCVFWTRSGKSHVIIKKTDIPSF